MSELGSAIVGVGMTPFERRTSSTAAELAHQAVRRALDDAEVSWSDIDATFVGNVYQGGGVGQRLLNDTPLMGRPIVNVENMCASGGTALREALAWVGAGFCDVALVLGVEVLSGSGGVLAPPADDLAGAVGSVFAASYAFKAQRYFADYDVSAEELARVTVKSRRHAALNPYAPMQEPVTVEEVLASPMISDPLTRLQCCPNSDGAAAVVVTSAEWARAKQKPAVRVLGSAATSGRRRDRTDPHPDVTAVTAAEAYEQASLGPEDLDLVEVHDAFSIGEVLHYGNLGLCLPENAGRYIAEGRSALGGDGVVVNPSGGLLSRGHPLAATGVAQIVEIVWQLRGQAGERQVPGARIGLAHIMGGNVTQVDSNACLVHVLAAA